MGTLLIGAVSLSVIFAREAAFPVQMFGRAAVDEPLEPLALRGDRIGEVFRGRLVDFTLAGELDAEAGGELPPLSPTERELEEGRRLAGVGLYERAIAADDRILSSREGSDLGAIERARLLSWSGNDLAAARALRGIAQTGPEDAALRLEAAQFFWYAG